MPFYTAIVWASVLFSAFIDNIPYVATMLPVVTSLAAGLGIDPTVLYFGLLSGATLGGNCTPIGASANITGIGILRRDGHEVKTSDFCRIGIPLHPFGRHPGLHLPVADVRRIKPLAKRQTARTLWPAPFCVRLLRLPPDTQKRRPSSLR